MTSIGMEYSNTGLTLQMVPLESLNAQLSREIRSYIISLSQTRQEHFGITLITVGIIVICQEFKTICSIATQYCDGLRGPLVIYDPKDPYRKA